MPNISQTLLPRVRRPHENLHGRDTYCCNNVTPNYHPSNSLCSKHHHASIESAYHVIIHDISWVLIVLHLSNRSSTLHGFWSFCKSIAIISLVFKPWYQFNMMLFYIHDRLWVDILIFHNNIKWLSLVLFLLCTKGRIVYRIKHSKVENLLSQECGPRIRVEERMQLVNFCTPWKCGPWTHNIVGNLCHV